MTPLVQWTFDTHFNNEGVCEMADLVMEEFSIPAPKFLSLLETL